MRILGIGDIVGENALKRIEEILPQLKEKYNIDFVIANGENVVRGRGINKECFTRLINAGVNVVTMGNHTYSNKDIYDINDDRLIVPLNYTKETINKGYIISKCENLKIFVANVLGKGLGATLNGFNSINEIISNLDENIKIRIIDFHSEYGNEKRSMAYMLRNRISVLYGTHTHITTADEQILDTGIGYITDIGMCGPIDSGIGYDLEFEVERYTKELKDDSRLSNDVNCSFNSCLFEIDEKTGKTTYIERINL